MSTHLQGTTPAGVGATYIPVDRSADVTNVQVIANGTVTFTVDWTNANIRIGGKTGGNPVNVREGGVDAASATWENLIASGSASTSGQAAFPIDALRIDITAGTGSVTYRIVQQPNYPAFES